MTTHHAVPAGTQEARKTLPEMLAWCQAKLSSGMSESGVRASLSAWLISESADVAASGQTCSEAVLDDLIQLRDMARESKGGDTASAQSLRRLYAVARQRVLARMKMGAWYMMLRRGASGLATVRKSSDGLTIQGQELDALMEFARVCELHTAKETAKGTPAGLDRVAA